MRGHEDDHADAEPAHGKGIGYWANLEPLRIEAATLRERLRAADAARDAGWYDCKQHGPCARPPGCVRHWAERNAELVRERDAAREEARNLRLGLAELENMRKAALLELEKLRSGGT